MRAAAKRAAKKGAKTFVWFNYRRAPAIGHAWNLIRKGRIGRIYHVRASYLQSWGGKDTPLVWRFQKKNAGSGAHGDLNAHIVALARFLVGEEIVAVPEGATSSDSELHLSVSPNPCRSSAIMELALPASGPCRVGLYDVAGRLVVELRSGPLPAGVSRLRWKGTDATGRPVASGVYFARLSHEGRSETVKVLVVR